MQAPTVTWNMAVKNAMPFLPEALESIASQSYRDFEILAWDNGSTDGSPDVLTQWIPERIRGKVVIDRPLPLGECRARMVLESRSELIAVMDADDRCRPERLQRQVEILSQQSDVVGVGVQQSAIDCLGKPLPLPEPLRMETDFTGILHVMMIGYPMAHAASVFRRGAMLEVGNYRTIDPTNHVGEDVDLMMRLSTVGRLESLEDTLYTYRFHGGSISQNLADVELGEERMDQVFAENALPLYGWSKREALALRRLRVPFAFPLLVRAAKTIRKRTGCGIASQFRMASWHRSCARLTKRRDVVTRMLWRMFFSRIG